MKNRLIRWGYTLLLALVSPIFLWGLYRSKANKPQFGSRWKEHFGITPPLSHSDQGVIWIHAVSVGEVLSSRGLVKALSEQYPHRRVLITTTTSTGAQQVQAFDPLLEHRYMPIDFSYCIESFLRRIKPSVLLIIETELWPNTLHTVARFGIPIILVNGRLSEKSLDNYRKLNALIRPALTHITCLLSVHQQDAQRFESLGVTKDKIWVTGSLKYDITLDPTLPSQAGHLREQLGNHRAIFIAASTHEGEDEQVLAAYRDAKSHIPELLLVLVPRHPERFNSVAELILQQGFNLARRTKQDSEKLADTVDVYLADTMGEMMLLLAASDVVFMGGSLLGKKVGGHNFIEPSILSKPMITGPSFFNFSDLAQQLIDVGALTVVENQQQLAQSIVEICCHLHSWQSKAQSGYNVIIKNQGALQRTLQALQPIIEKNP
ncbi:lipid IV(A) 3-deoxy-D-manno-octulosonic acid transferase [Vibrio metschnikovii]|uniref:lipid IV(A) 3-deoxy-D-manno-octulosonic acid transferase n=1 Tax=Vibrio metschnikovii TaxID=28172 RepID=UPI002A649CA0|nr:lipid IV(A) 3-deoxy-D-manno-octulosonic acid transferase [Vibrio metschnikovii]EKO3721533.1 lipid IV(A) 3-deoxy-D-manno-octulosonic acid transferase [Vibrio metschnikovii]EKO3724425.1 lipid IV(A) 3-deoxy-D-manno-octulosonic acid transferase [Vibrio metschnikovii]EKO3739959.1 lipid IV(A) 3-deoxy-D-manno-octulosonic acid transferase [Vibrio metschnikovii]EKO3878718.1 lipid IV(A) 3-deoxy-D-manno-octulosonic acid transferase [Vibrio metschnikovii]